MRWAQISVDVSRESEDAVSNLLIEMGAGGVQIEDKGSISDRIIVTAYFPPDDMIGERVSKVTELLDNMRDLNIDVGAGRVYLHERLDERDWSERWKEFFKPLPIGDRVLVFPSWEDVTESPPRDILIQMDPGMAFGTGRHPTTVLCLELLENVLKGDEKVADIGTGSGILAIAAAKLGAKKVVAVDVDARAAAIARENSQRNGVSGRIHVICGELLNAVNGRYNVVVSNISGKAILSMISDLKFYLGVDGRLILSGILEREVSEIENELESSNFVILETRRDEEWVAVLAKASA
jgi:ribosomal protein L11 methyltransferase